jgi:ketosteroid isomerase-like protein
MLEITMSDQSEFTVQHLKNILDAFNRHDLEAIMEFFADDAELYMPKGSTSRGQLYTGKAAVREGLASRFKSIPDVHYSEDEHWVCGNRGVSQWTLTGTTSENIKLNVRGCDLWIFQEGKIIQKNSFWKIVQ